MRGDHEEIANYLIQKVIVDKSASGMSWTSLGTPESCKTAVCNAVMFVQGADVMAINNEFKVPLALATPGTPLHTLLLSVHAAAEAQANAAANC